MIKLNESAVEFENNGPLIESLSRDKVDFARKILQSMLTSQLVFLGNHWYLTDDKHAEIPDAGHCFAFLDVCCPCNGTSWPIPSITVLYWWDCSAEITLWATTADNRVLRKRHSAYSTQNCGKRFLERRNARGLPEFNEMEGLTFLRLLDWQFSFWTTSRS